MRWWIVGVVAFVAFMVVVGIAATRAENDCEETGGRWEFDHYQPQIVMVGKTPVVQQIPIYGCHR